MNQSDQPKGMIFIVQEVWVDPREDLARSIRALFVANGAMRLQRGGGEDEFIIQEPNRTITSVDRNNLMVGYGERVTMHIAHNDGDAHVFVRRDEEPEQDLTDDERTPAVLADITKALYQDLATKSS